MDVVEEVTVIKTTYEAILKSAASNAWVYSYSSLQDFTKLWSPDLVKRMLDKTQQEPITIVVIWDGMPPAKTFGIASLAELITPVDWAVGFSIAVAKASGAEASADSIPNLRIVILDLLSHVYTHAPGIKLINQFPKRQLLSMPWLHVAMPFGPTSISSSPVETLSRLGIVDDSKDQDLRQFPTMQSIASEKLLDNYIDSLSHLWCSLAVMAPDLVDHHAVSNVIAPLVILRNQGDDTCPHQRAVLQLYKWIGLIIDKSRDEPSNFWKRPTVEEDLKRVRELLGKDYKLNFLLIDDAAYKHKWKHVLERFLGDNFDRYCKLTCTDSVEELLSCLPTEDSPIDLGDFRLRFHSKNGGESDEVDLLFLDLRLVPVGSSRERELVRTVLEAANQFLKRGSGRFAKGPLSNDALNRVASYLEHGESPEGGYDDAITLLPRLIASLNSSLPIFVFSSTGRGDIIRILSKYSNIFCRWSKPRLQNHAFDSLLSEAWLRFHDELAAAFAWLPGRAALRYLRNFSAENHTNETKAKNARWTLKIYIDESGAPETRKGGKLGALKVGGLIMIVPADGEDRFELFLQSKNVDRLSKKVLREQASDLLKEFFEQQHNQEGVIKPFVFGGSLFNNAGNLTKDSQYRDAQSDYLENHGVGDNFWRKLASYALERLIYLYGRRVVGHSGAIDLEIHVATRERRYCELIDASQKTYPTGVNFTESNLRKLLVEILDLEEVRIGKKKEPGVRFVSRETPRSIFQNVRAYYTDDKFEVTAKEVRGRSINRKFGAALSHVFADAVLDLLQDYVNGRTKIADDQVKEFFDYRIAEKYGETLLTLLAVQRHLANGGIADALSAFVRGGIDHDYLPKSEADCARQTLAWLSEATEDLTSEQIRAVALEQRKSTDSPKAAWYEGDFIGRDGATFISVTFEGKAVEIESPENADALNTSEKVSVWLTRAFDNSLVVGDLRQGQNRFNW